MKTKHFFIAAFLVAILTVLFSCNSVTESEISSEELREKHQIAFENSPFKKTKVLSRQDRKNLGLPPNAYNEQMWELMLDPQTGRPMPERVLELQEQLRFERQETRGVGGDNSNPWIDRGPNNVGGRTRGIMFDPNDSNYERVFAGGVSGGLWVNNDITDANSSWTLVPGIGANISVTAIIVDPNNTNTFYIGSGESYTSGAAIGRGIWKSTDAGVTWTNIFGGYTGVTGTQFIDGIFYINDIIARDVGGTTELYASIAGDFYGSSSPSQFHGLQEQGVYRSTNNGATWTKITINDGSGNPKNPNDLELDINNNIWMSTTRSSWGTSNGGDIYRSANGTTFTQVGSITGAHRTELEPSPTNANELWVAANVPGSTQQADLFTITYNTGPGTITISTLTEPNDSDPGIPATDYTRGQAFYDLPIESDGSGNLIVGGIDLHRSTNGGSSWSQISQWYNFGAGVSIVHADMHAIVQRPGTGNENKYVFGTDGGVFYSDNITLASGSTSNITSRNNNYNVTQFYYGAIDGFDSADGDDLVGGSQDNGTQFVIDAGTGANSFFDPVGGDGGFSEIDDDGQYAISTYPYNTHVYLNYPSAPNTGFVLSTPGPNSNPNGSFINQAELDKNLDILYSNASVGTNYRIERMVEFLPGGPAQVNTFLSDASLNAAPSAFKVSPYVTGSTELYVGLTNGRLLKIDNANGTPTWNILSTPFVGSISDIEFGDNVNGLEFFVSMHNYGVTSIWFTDDGGSSWTSIEGNLPDLPVKCILQNPLIPEEIIVGTELGVWATGDYTQPSPIWVQTYNGMSDVTVVDLDLRSSDNVILATTHGRGLFTSQFTSTTLSIDDTSFDENTLILYPTISNGNFTLKTNRALGKINFSIYDLNGKEVFVDRFILNSTKKEFNISLNSGIYLVKIKSNNSLITKKIIIN